MALVAQSALETGYWKINSKSIFNLTDQTNGYGMKYPKYARPLIKGGITSSNGSKWAVYNNLYDSTLDRIAWEEIWTTVNPSGANNFSDYVQRIGKVGYWGNETAYPNLWTKIYETHYSYIASLYKSPATNTEKDQKLLIWIFTAICALGLMGALTR